MFKTTYFGEISIHLWEYLLAFVYLIIIFSIAYWVRNRNVRQFPEYKYYIPGLLAKIFGGIIFALIYLYYYHGGDTQSYYTSGLALANLFWKSPIDFFHVIFGSNSIENLYYFDSHTGYPLGYIYSAANTYTVVKVVAPILILSFKSYLLSTIVIAWLSFYGLWKLFLLFCRYYKTLSFQFAIAVLFFPSVLFWGSGILKDTITLSASCWYVYAIYWIFIKKRKRGQYIIVLVLCSWLIVLIKAYIIIALLPGSLIWIFFDRINRIRNKIIKYMIMPFIFIVCIGIGFGFLSFFSGILGKYSLNKIATTASVTQEDLKQSYYHGESFNIGHVAPTFGSMLSHAPQAIVAGIYRPFIWESKSLVMLLSGAENTFILLLTITLIFKLKLGRFFRILFNNPLLVFILSYSIIFAFSVGISTSNFGSLVRFKIAYLPFFVASLFILRHYMQNKTQLNVSG